MLNDEGCANQISTAKLEAFIMKAKKKLAGEDDEQIGPMINVIKSSLLMDSGINNHLKFHGFTILAAWYQRKQNYGQAAENFRKALDLVRELNQTEGNLIIDTYLKYIALEREYKQENKARLYLAKLFQWLDRNRIWDNMAYGLAYSYSGKLFLDDNHTENGIQQMNKALAYFKKAVPYSHPIIDETVDTIAAAYIKAEDYQHALIPYQHRLKELKKDATAYGRILLKIGEVHYYIDVKKAKRTIQRAASIFENTHKKAGSDIVQAHLMLGELDEHMANYESAIQHFKKVLDLLRTTHVKQASSVSFVYGRIGLLFMEVNKFKQAKAYLEKGLPLSKSYRHVRMQILYALGKIYAHEERYTVSDKFFTEFLYLLDKYGYAISKSYADTLQSIALNASKQNKWQQAITYYLDALSIYEQLVSASCHADMGRTYLSLASCYEQVDDNYKETSEYYYKKGYRIIKKTHVPKLMKKALSALLDFYTRHGEEEEKKWYEDQMTKLEISI